MPSGYATQLSNEIHQTLSLTVPSRLAPPVTSRNLEGVFG